MIDFGDKKEIREHSSPETARNLRFQIPMACAELDSCMQFFIEKLEFRLESIYPSDSPHTVILFGHDVSIRLSINETSGVELLELLCRDGDRLLDEPRELVAPNGVIIKILPSAPPLKMPVIKQQLVLTKEGENSTWSVGRAGMHYRDLLPERHGGTYIASHIRILEGGLVPDYVHYHNVRFQMIFCRKGWVKVTYEGQGEPMVLKAGDCVLQPPLIRHRVMESSAGAEVVELTSPAAHITLAEHEMTLPNQQYEPEHDFNGQRFVRYVAEGAAWNPWRLDGFQTSDTGIGKATDGLAGVRRVKLDQQPTTQQISHDTEFCFFFILSGAMTLHCENKQYSLAENDSIAIPGKIAYSLTQCSSDLEFLEVTSPAEFKSYG